MIEGDKPSMTSIVRGDPGTHYVIVPTLRASAKFQSQATSAKRREEKRTGKKVSVAMETFVIHAMSGELLGYLLSIEVSK